MVTATRTRKRVTKAAAADPVRAAAKAQQNGRKEVASAPVKDPLAVNANEVPKKARKSRVAKGTSPKGQATMAGTDDDPNQTYIPGTAPPKDAEIEDVMAGLIKLEEDAAETRSAVKKSRGKLTELMRDRNIHDYKFMGRIAKYKPGTDSVAIVEAPAK